MAPEDVLVMAMALPPVLISAGLWWSARHALDELQDSWRPIRRRGSGAAPTGVGEPRRPCKARAVLADGTIGDHGSL